MDNISSLTSPEVIPKTGQILAVLAKEPSLYQAIMSLLPSAEELTECHQVHQATYNAAGGGDPEKLKELEAARKVLNRKYTIFTSLVKLAALEDPSLLPKFGITPHKPKKTTASPLVSPLNLRVRHGQNSREMIVKVEPVRNAKSYDISYCCDGDPSVEENWTHYGIGVKASKLDVTGLVPGKIYWFRVRAIGAYGPGPWSQYASLMAI